MKRNNKRNNNKRNNKRNNMTGFYTQNAQDEIIVTDHVIDQYRLREQKEAVTNDEAKRAIIQQIKQSRLLVINEEGQEHRSYYGQVYVCKREKGLLRDKLVAVTMKLTKIRRTMKFAEDFDLENVDYKAMGTMSPEEKIALRKAI